MLFTVCVCVCVVCYMKDGKPASFMWFFWLLCYDREEKCAEKDSGEPNELI